MRCCRFLLCAALKNCDEVRNRTEAQKIQNERLCFCA